MQILLLISVESFVYGEGYALPTPTRDHYSFVGWFTTYNGTVAATDILQTDSGEKSFYAKWEVNKYTVTINVSNTEYGTVNKSTVLNVPYGTVLSASGNVLNVNGTNVTATKASTTDTYTYAFVDWTNGSITVDGNITVTANFSRSFREYTISYIQNGGSGATNDTYTWESETITLPNASEMTKEGYNFVGWTATSAETDISYITEISTGSTGNKTFYAKWTDKNTISITETAQAPVTYNGNGVAFNISGTNSNLVFIVEYYVNGSWTNTLPVNAGSYNVKISRSEDASFKAYTKEITNGLVISKKEVTFKWNTTNVESGTEYSTSYIYAGTIQGVYPFITNICNDDDVSLTITNNTAKNASLSAYVTGEVVLSGADKANYKLPSSGLTKEFNISAKQLVVTWKGENNSESDFSWVYTGSAFIPSATVTTGIGEETVALTVTTISGGAIGVSSYIATASMTVSNANYTITNQTKDFAITGATIISDEAFSNYNVAYDKASHTIIYDSSKITVVNDQTITVKYSIDNLTWVDSVSYSDFTNGAKTIYWKVSAPNHLDLTGSGTILISPKTVGLTWGTIADLVYNKTAKTTTATATGLEENDTCTVSVMLTAGKDNINVGTFTYTANGLSNANYKLPDNVTSTSYTITAKQITISAEAKSSLEGSDLVALTYTLSENALIGSDTLTGVLATTAIKNEAGVYPIVQGTLSAGNNYAIVFVGNNYTVKAATITAQNPDPEKPEDQDNIQGEIDSEDGFGPNTTLVVKVIAVEKAETTLTVPNGKEFAKTYNATLYVNSVKTDPQGMVTIKFAKSASLPQADSYSIIIVENGETVIKTGTVEGDYIVFTASSLGDFAIIVDKNDGDTFISLLWLIILLSIINGLECVAIGVLIRRNRDDKKRVQEIENQERMQMKKKANSVKLNSFVGAYPIIGAIIFNPNEIIAVGILGLSAVILACIIVYLALKSYKARKMKAQAENDTEEYSDVESVGDDLKVVIETATETAVVHTEISKKTIADYLENTYLDKVIANRRVNYTSTGLPLADTHFVVKGSKKTCFAFVYEVDGGKVFLLLKTDKDIVRDIKKEHPLINNSRFPKSTTGQWYSLIIDNSFHDGKELFDILSSIYNRTLDK